MLNVLVLNFHGNDRLFDKVFLVEVYKNPLDVLVDQEPQQQHQNVVDQLNFVDHVIVVKELFELQLIMDLLNQQKNDYNKNKRRTSVKEHRVINHTQIEH
jgi:hypothetical protein